MLVDYFYYYGLVLLPLILRQLLNYSFTTVVSVGLNVVVFATVAVVGFVVGIVVLAMLFMLN
jgi:hypothetical protein